MRVSIDRLLVCGANILVEGSQIYAVGEEIFLFFPVA